MDDLGNRDMDEGNREYIVRCNGAILCREFDFPTAINRAYKELVSRPNGTVEVIRRRGERQAILWRVAR